MWTQGQWGTEGMGHMGNEAHRGKVVQGYGAHRHRDTGANGVWGIWAMRPTGVWVQGYGPHGQ